jgi:hypothetical protein
LWRWSCHGPGITASGTLTTRSAANADGFYAIIAVSGKANGVPIVRLQQTGTSIPGNHGFPVDNLIRQEGRQLTKHGFAFSLANGTFASPFYAAHFSTPGYYLFLSDPATGRTREPRVTFVAASGIR